MQHNNKFNINKQIGKFSNNIGRTIGKLSATDISINMGKLSRTAKFGGAAFGASSITQAWTGGVKMLRNINRPAVMGSTHIRGSKGLANLANGIDPFAGVRFSSRKKQF